MLSNMEVSRINQIEASVKSAHIAFKYLVASGKLTGSQFVAYCVLFDTIKDFEKYFQEYCENEL